MYKDGDVQNALLRNEAVEWLDKPALSTRSGSPQKARSKVSTGATSPREGTSPTFRPRPSVKGTSSPQRKRSRLQAGSQGPQLPKAAKSGQSARRASTGQVPAQHADVHRPSASVQSEQQTSSRPGVVCRHASLMHQKHKLQDIVVFIRTLLLTGYETSVAPCTSDLICIMLANVGQEPERPMKCLCPYEQLHGCMLHVASFGSVAPPGSIPRSHQLALEVEGS